MLTPLQKTFRGAITTSPSLIAAIDHHVAKLESKFDRITSCHVTIDTPHRRRTHGGHFAVRLDFAIPGRRFIVSRDPTERRSRADVYAAIDDVFNEALRILTQYTRRVHSHAVPRTA